MSVESVAQVNAWSVSVLSWLGVQVLYSSIIFLLIWAVNRLLRVRDPFWLIALWALVPLRLVLPPSFYSPVAFSGFFHRLFEGRRSFPAIWPEADVIQALQHAGFFNSSVHGKQALLGSIPWALVLSILWLAGIITLTMVFLRRDCQRRTLIRNAKHITHPCLQDLQFQYGISAPIRLMIHSGMFSPFTTGWRHPLICIPETFLRHDALKCILAHEMAHIKRRDALFLVLQSIVTIIYFFDPLLWIANRRINFYRECLCDRLALKSGRLDASHYGNNLLSVLSVMAAKPQWLCSSPALGHYHQELAQRFQLLKGGLSMHSPKKCYRTVLVFVFTITVLPFAGSEQSRFSTFASDNKNQDSVEGEKANWLPKTAIQFINPLPAGVTTLGFGPARDPFNGTSWQHIGIDLRAPVGESVKACADGQVIDAVEEYTLNEGRGRYITIQHQDGFASRYAHLQSLNVKQGDQVHAGDVIATVGSTGRSTGPHLHFELLKDNEPQNPQEYIEFKK